MNNELQVIEQNAIIEAFKVNGGTDALFEQIAKEARSHVPDVTTKKGRDAIGSLALKVSKSKTLIEKYGKDLVAEQKAKIKLVDDDRIAVVKKLDELRNEILAPRDAWEQAEKDRVAKHNQFIASIIVMSASEQYENRGSEYIKQMLASIEEIVIDSSLEEFEQEAKIAKFEALEKLRTTLAERQKYEAEQAELERLRQAEIERQKRENEARIAREATEKAQREAEEKARLESERVAREKLEAEQREARLKAEHEASLLREAELKRQAEERAKQAEIDQKNAIEAERKRIEAEQEAKAKAEHEAEQARLANQEHRKTICNEALQGLLSIGVSDELGKQILQAIHKGNVPHVSIKF